MLGIFLSTAFAQAAGGAAATPSRPGLLETAFPFLAILVVFYFFSARPTQKRAREHQDFLTAIKRGDQVITSSGILGEVAGLTEKFVTLQVDDDVRIKVLRSQIMGPATKEGNA